MKIIYSTFAKDFDPVIRNNRDEHGECYRNETSQHRKTSISLSHLFGESALVKLKTGHCSGRNQWVQQDGKMLVKEYGFS